MKQAKNVLCVGIPGTGKSYYVGSLIEDDVIDDGYFCILLDPKFGEDGVYGDHKGLSEDLGFAHEHITSDFIDSLVDSNGVKSKVFELLKMCKSKGFNGVRFTFDSIDPDLTDDKMRLFAEEIARIGLKLDGKILLVEEECHNFVPHNQRGGSSKDLKAQSKFIDEGRRINKKAILSTQKPQKVNKDFYDAVQLYILFFMGSTLTDYTRILPDSRKNEYREATDWSVDGRNLIRFNRNTGELELLNVDGLNRKTRHTG